MSARIFALSLTAVALTVVPAMAEELLMGDSVVQSDGYDGGCCKVEKDCTPQCCCEPLWTFRAGVLVLKQESPSEAKEFDFDFEAGIYYNQADWVVTQAVPSVTLYAVEDNHTAFLGEWDLTATFALTECIALRASYELMWIAGTAAALAPHMPNLDTGGNHFYHGGVIGVEMTR